MEDMESTVEVIAARDDHNMYLNNAVLVAIKGKGRVMRSVRFKYTFINGHGFITELRV
jgi:hypothetical protein